MTNQLYLAVREIEAKDLPPAGKWAVWFDLYTDAARRLEQTTEHYALEFEFENEKLAENALIALRKWFKERQGAGAVNLRRRDQLVYVWRGPNYSKAAPETSGLAHRQARRRNNHHEVTDEPIEVQP